MKKLTAIQKRELKVKLKWAVALRKGTPGMIYPLLKKYGAPSMRVCIQLQGGKHVKVITQTRYINAVRKAYEELRRHFEE